MNPKSFRKNSLVILSFILFLYPGSLAAQVGPWVQVDEGLFVGEFVSQKSSVGDSKILISKIDPEIYSSKLLCASEQNHANLTAKEWCQKYKLIAAINAGMFQMDYKSNVGYMKNYAFINNPRISTKYHSVAAFSPMDGSKPEFRIYDIDEENMQQIINNYHIVIQNLRLIKRPAQNRWSKQSKKWSEAALGEDKAGNVLFIFSRIPFSMHDFNKILINLPIDIVCAQHLEGGPEASLYFRHNNREIEVFGSYETGFNKNDDNRSYWPIPNVIGFVKKKR